MTFPFVATAVEDGRLTPAWAVDRYRRRAGWNTIDPVQQILCRLTGVNQTIRPPVTACAIHDEGNRWNRSCHLAADNLLSPIIL